jgi:hypothetical protein
MTRSRPRILVQTTIRRSQDDWHVGRFSLLAEVLREVGDVVARDLEPDARGDDPLLSRLDRSQFDQAWLLGVDGGTVLSRANVAAVNGFHRAGGGLLTTRDHQDMGLWLRGIDGVGRAHYFHADPFREPDPARCCPDDRETPAISWPNYHSGRNGDTQRVSAVEPLHPLMLGPGERVIELFPAHPHEGAIGVPVDEPRARSVARGKSQVTGRAFDLVVAFERAPGAPGRAIAESSFHHFADYNWDLSRGAPSFVTEPEGHGMQEEPRALEDVHAYVRNAARWLVPAD